MREFNGPPQWPAQMHPYKRMRLGGRIVIVDALLADVVRALNQAGTRTDFCCQGNHRADEDRRLGLCGAYISVEGKGGLPQSLLAHARKHGFETRSRHHLYATPPAIAKPSRQIRANNRQFVRMLRKWAESQ